MVNSRRYFSDHWIVTSSVCMALAIIPAKGVWWEYLPSGGLFGFWRLLRDGLFLDYLAFIATCIHYALVGE